MGGESGHDFLQWAIFGGGAVVVVPLLGYLFRRVITLAKVEQTVSQMPAPALVAMLEQKVGFLDHRLDDQKEAMANARERDKELFQKIDALSDAINTFGNEVSELRGALGVLMEKKAA